jgi:hypothetical protein
VAITRKPKPAAMTAAPAVDVDALINKGGSVARETATPATANKPVAMTLRVPGDLMIQVDQAVEVRRVKVPRHTWIIEAIVEKLERETLVS